MSKYQCDCGGNIKEYNPNVRVCQKCKKIPNVDTLVDVLREIGVKEETLENLKKDIHYIPV